MVKKFTGKKVTMWISIILAISIQLGIAVPENIQADGTENPDAIYSITAFQNPEYTFQTVDGKTTTTLLISIRLLNWRISMMFLQTICCREPAIKQISIL